MQRRALRQRADYEPTPQPTIVKKDGYKTLRPTKGWVWMSNARLAAQQAMSRMLDHVLPDRRKKPPKVWRKLAPPAPATETRQQRRAKARQG